MKLQFFFHLIIYLLGFSDLDLHIMQITKLTNINVGIGVHNI